VISASTYTSFYDIDTSVSRRWDASVSNGVICLDVNVGGTVVVGNRRGRASDAASTDGD